MKTRLLLLAACLGSFSLNAQDVERETGALSGLIARFAWKPYAPSPIPCGPEAHTRSNFVMTVARPFYARHWLEPFKASAEARTPWAAVATNLLEREVFGLAAGWTGGLNDTRAQAAPLVAQGCTYPVIRWMYARHLEKENKADEALRVMTALEGEMATNAAWASPLRALASYGMMRLASNETHEVRLADALFTALTDGSFRTNETRVAWQFCEFCGMDKSPRLLRRLERATEPRPDPWFALMIRGQLAYDKAWEARGGGYADTVTEDGWAGFGESMKEAREVLAQAWRLHPEIPCAASLLIDCSRGDPDECRLWFDRAVAAQMDFSPAYTAYSFTLTPRWGGSLEALEAFGQECLETRRFDTDVPFRYVMQYSRIADEMKDGWQALYQKPGVYENCRMLIENALSQGFATNWVSTRYYHSALAYIAYAAADYDTAWQSAQNLRRPDGRIAYDKGLRPPPPFHDIAMTMISGMNGPNKAVMRAADRLAREGREEQALASFTALAESRKLADDEIDALAYWVTELGKRRACASNEWFSLIQTHTTPFLDGPWISYNNSWRFSNQTWRTDSKNGLLGSTVALPREVAYELTFAPLDPDPQAPCHFGFALDSKPGTTVEGPVLWLSRDKGQWSSAWVRRFGSDARSSRPLSAVQTLAGGATNAFHLSITSQGDKVTAAVNGETLCSQLDFSEVFYDRLRSGRLPYLFGSKVALTEWKFRRLKADTEQ